MDPVAWQPDPPAWQSDPLAWQPRPKFRDRLWVHAVLLALTIVTTTLLGAGQYFEFAKAMAGVAPRMSAASFVLHGFWYSGTILAILGCHELGHYLACR